MHRGGTSALAGTLQALGVEFGDNLIPGQADNPLGFFEHREVILANEAILQAVGSSWCSPLPHLPARDWTRHARRPLDEATRLLADQFGRAPLWGLKDPRLSRLLPVWQSVFARLDCSPCYVLIIRPPAEVAASVAKRDGIASKNAQRLWVDHLLTAEADTRGQPRVILTYDALLADWRGAVANLAARLDLAWPRPPADPAVAAEIDGFLQPDLRHHQQRGQAGTLRAAQEVYKLLARLAAVPAGEPAAAQPILAALDEHRRLAAEWTWQPDEESLRLRREWQQTQKVVADLDAEIKRARSDRAVVLEDRVKAQEIIETHEAELGGLRGDLALVLQDRRAAQTVIDENQAELVRLRADRAALVADRRKAQGILEAYEAEIAGLRADRELVVADRREAQRILEVHEAEIAGLRKDRELVVADRREAQRILEVHEAEIRRLQGERENLATDRRKAQDILDEQASEIKGLRTERALVVADRRKAQDILEAYEVEIGRLRDERESLMTDRRQTQEVLEGYDAALRGFRVERESLEAEHRQTRRTLAARATEVETLRREREALWEERRQAQVTAAAQADELKTLREAARILHESPRHALATALGATRRYLKLASTR